ncbi:MAG TPA: class I tRNA ligase family protein, partial [Solirubrobacteraceae bacterium]|nr:class I tRNA ligase family protein [Solirubrobacteraceae bacterium]
MSEEVYRAEAVEPRWQRIWADERTWEVAQEAPAPGGRAYVVEPPPYPSGDPHLGHLKIYSFGDAMAHYHRLRGRRVVHAMGYDAFGLPAENHAVRTGTDPRVSTDASIEEFRRQFLQWGLSIDPSREFGTHEPEYYRWTQWIFLKMLERGLAYRGEGSVKWCPVDQTVLANEQVLYGCCERCGSPVEIRKLTQWFLRITDYADRLLDGLEEIDWPNKVKNMQRNWIGRSEGAEVVFRCEEPAMDLPIYTTRPDALFGATFFVMAPEHPAVLDLVAGTEREGEVREYVEGVLRERPQERGAPGHKTGVPLGRFAVNPVNGERLPIFVTEYVLMEYGTGAVMGVPAHDQRDYEFALAFDLPVRLVVAPAQGAPEGGWPEGGGPLELPYAGEGVVVNSSSEWEGLPN